MSKRQRGAEGRGASWELAVRVFVGLVHVLSKVLRKLSYEQIAALGKPENEPLLDRMAVAVGLINSGKELVVREIEKVLDFLGSATVPAPTSSFVAKDNFRLKKDGGICSYFGGNFAGWFLSGEGKIEDPFPATVLHYSTLLKMSLDTPIIAELGGEANAETALMEVFSLMAKQANGESGSLLENGSANIFYVRDRNGVLRAVHMYWYGGGWDVRAHSVSDPDEWNDGARVFSRNSVLESSATLVS